jgi:cytoskeletal protein CcmA (bactofilin family)
MFSTKNKSGNDQSMANSASIIGGGNTITGNIECNGDIRIDGTIKGNVYSNAKLLIGPGGFVEGNIFCNEADISGQVCGNITCKGLLVLKGSATLAGDVHTVKLFIEPTVSFNGQCHMGANIVELKADMALAVNE